MTAQEATLIASGMAIVGTLAGVAIQWVLQGWSEANERRIDEDLRDLDNAAHAIKSLSNQALAAAIDPSLRQRFALTLAIHEVAYANPSVVPGGDALSEVIDEVELLAGRPYARTWLRHWFLGIGPETESLARLQERELILLKAIYERREELRGERGRGRNIWTALWAAIWPDR